MVMGDFLTGMVSGSYVSFLIGLNLSSLKYKITIDTLSEKNYHAPKTLDMADARTFVEFVSYAWRALRHVFRLAKRGLGGRFASGTRGESTDGYRWRLR